MDVESLTRKLARRSYAEIARELASLNDNELVMLLDSPSIKVGDTAVSHLKVRKRMELIIDAATRATVKSSLGRVRIVNALRCHGQRLPQAKDLFLKFLLDRSVKVVDCALFGLAFFQDITTVSAIESITKNKRMSSKERGLFEKALRALRKRDPFIYAPSFRDAADVWGLDKTRFPNKIG